MRTVAILVVLICAFGKNLVAQARPAPPDATESQAPYRSPVTAAVLGTLVPGAGHIYAGEYAKGVRYYYGSVSGIGGGTLMFLVGGMSAEGQKTSWPMQATGVLLVGLGMSVWVRSALDAPRAAARSTAKHRQATTRVSLILRNDAVEQRSSNIGFAVAW
jgi:TM2 domain-containing membrane protein YozV